MNQTDEELRRRGSFRVFVPHLSPNLLSQVRRQSMTTNVGQGGRSGEGLEVLLFLVSVFGRPRTSRACETRSARLKALATTFQPLPAEAALPGSLKDSLRCGLAAWYT